jgi:hypothetical protein
MAQVELTGFKAVRDNFEKLDKLVQKQIANDALRYFGWLVASPMRRATYTTFNRQTGAIRKGLSVAVQGEPQSSKLKAWVVEYPQSIAGAETPFKTLVRKRISKKSRRAAPVTYTAFWWRYLEFGTAPRRARRTVKPTTAKWYSSRHASQLRMLKKQQSSPSRGAITPRTWLRPTFSGVAPDALKSFRDYFLKLVDAAVSAMSKT